MLLTAFYVLTIGVFVKCRTLKEIVCEINPHRCEHSKIDAIFENSLKSKLHLAAPSIQEFQRWQNYETQEPGTGLARAEQGRGFGPGLGDVAVNTGIGIQHPYGGLGIERDFELSFGGSGRIGGIPVGFGNGYQPTRGAAPFYWP